MQMRRIAVNHLLLNGTCGVFLFLLIIWQAVYTLNLVLFFVDNETSKYQSVSFPGTSQVQIIKTLGAPHERISFQGSRLSDQRAYGEVWVYDLVDGEVHYYLREGHVVFSALLVYSPLPLQTLWERFRGDIAVATLWFLLTFLLILMRRIFRAANYSMLLVAAGGMLSVRFISQPYHPLTVWGAVYGVLILCVILVIWLIFLMSGLRRFIVLVSKAAQ